MDFFGLVNPANGAFEHAMNDADDDASSGPYGITLTSTPGVYQCNPPAHTEIMTATASKNPLTFIPSVATTFVAGDTVRALGFGGLTVNGNSIVNYKDFAVRVDPSGNIVLLDAGGDPIDASAATDMAGPGNLRLVSVPAWVVPGALLYILCRKRAGNQFFLRGCKRPVLDLGFRGSAAVAVLGTDLTDPTIDVVAKSDGLISCNAGLIFLTDVRGTFRSSRIEAQGICDDMVNCRTRSWGRAVTAKTTDSLTVSFSYLPTPNVDPTLPMIGDMIEFILVDGIIDRSLVVIMIQLFGIVGNKRSATITFSEPVPQVTSYRDILVVNRSLAAAWRLGDVRLTGGAARAIVPQSGDWVVDRLYVRGTPGSAVRHLFPATDGVSDYAGAKGGGYIGEIVAESVVFNYRSTNNGVVVARVQNLGGTSIAQPTGWKPIVVGTLTARDYGFGAVMAQGVDVIVHSAVLIDGGARRSLVASLPPTLPGAVDYYAQQATLDILSNPNSRYLPTSYAAAGGRVVLPVGASRAVLTATFTTSSTTPAIIPSFGVPVKAGRLYTIRCVVRFRAAATTTGAAFSFDAPGTSTFFLDTWQIANTGQGTTAPTFAQARTATFDAASGGVDAANTDLLATCEGLFQAGIDGLLSLRVRSAVAGSVVSVMVNSAMIVSEIK